MVKEMKYISSLIKEGHYNLSKEMIQKGNYGQSFVEQLLNRNQNQQSNQRQ
ncbi:hypothetical protein N3Z17_06890 [Candidatus Bandiella numerosa]|jgi:hypothetical protein|uniref:hypothetical protein n=1 Tax=Candidatus Bandiella numerosa TaxID=2570586 RepID=UPI00249F5D5F|nr:hypothetical protein [Candidatus Bandiella numerosa]WHA04939.1 hypothetical protein N3Z17_06890 [Candidatus Bandiella numerosa]